MFLSICFIPICTLYILGYNNGDLTMSQQHIVYVRIGWDYPNKHSEFHMIQSVFSQSKIDARTQQEFMEIGINIIWHHNIAQASTWLIHAHQTL